MEQPAEVRTKRRGGLTGLIIRSQDGQFELHVTSVIGSLDDDGMLTFSASLTDLLLRTAGIPGASFIPTSNLSGNK
jgi:hypothetical protein